uniref:Uncharacterized protein n=1 Tax=Oryza punctata TaxID=4537 RepID=A0A0E0LE08_ORYPU
MAVRAVVWAGNRCISTIAKEWIRLTAIRRRCRRHHHHLLLLPISPLILLSPYCVRSRACVYQFDALLQTELWSVICLSQHPLRTKWQLTHLCSRDFFGAASATCATAWMLINGRAAMLGAGNCRLVLSDVASVPW